MAEPDLPPSWGGAIRAALSRDRPGPERRRAAEAAVAMARGGAGRGLALLALGRSQSGFDPDAAQATFSAALRAFDGSPVSAAPGAQARLQLAALALRRGDGNQVKEMAAVPLPTALAQGDAALVATLLFVRSESLLLLGRPDDAEAARLDGLAWEGYGLGEDGARSRLGEVRSLVTSLEES